MANGKAQAKALGMETQQAIWQPVSALKQYVSDENSFTPSQRTHPTWVLWVWPEREIQVKAWRSSR